VPKAVFELPLVTDFPALFPMNVLLAELVTAPPAPHPMAVLNGVAVQV
jgi:hypothetical protein